MGLFRKAQARRTPVDERRNTTWRDERPAWMVDGLEALLCEGRQGLEVVGESHYQDNLWQLVGGRDNLDDYVRKDIVALLVAESDNSYDSNAISVWIQGLKVGYLSRDDALRYRPGLLSLQERHGKPVALAGVIAGGGMRTDGPGRLGVFLTHDPADFGLRRTRPLSPTGAGMRTGLSAARFNDDADESSDLGWMRELPTEDIRAIPALRRMLNKEKNILRRHFMYTHLEAIIYRSRDAFASALSEYDEICKLHDAEMEAIRDAFIAKWGTVPVLETYRQMAIRQQKAKDFKQALWWAERGIMLYGDQCARPEALDDLRQRAAAYRSKLVGEESV